jgi:hypothetical protein
MDDTRANKFKTQWTEEKVNILLRLNDEGRTVREIETELGATKNAIIGKLHRMGRRVNGQPYSPKTIKPVRVRPRLVVYRTYAAFSPEYELQGEGTKPAKLSTSEPCDILSLTTQTCHWPLWAAPDDKNKLYCGAPSEGKVYCKQHAATAGQQYRRSANPQPFLLR